MKLLRHTTLRFQEGNSDKVYIVEIVEVAAQQHVVNFRYGRSGKALTEGSKTTAPVDLGKAIQVADSLLVSKINKGYQVLLGYDPVTKQTLGASATAAPDAPARKSKKAQGRDQQILARLYQFATQAAAEPPGLIQTLKQVVAGTVPARPGLIDGYSLSRSLWRAGELRIAGLAPALDAVLAALPAATPALTYYALAWAAGRSQDPAALPLLHALRNKIPEHWYQINCLQLGHTPELPPLEPDFAILPAIEAIQAFDRYAALRFPMLKADEQAYIRKVLHWQGLSTAVNQALSATVLADAEGDFLKLRLDAASYATVQASKAAVPELEPAITDTLDYHYNALLVQKKAHYQAEVDLYQELLPSLNLETTLRQDRNDIEQARSGNVQHLWGEGKRRLQNALKATGRIQDFNRFWQGLTYYRTLEGKTRKTVSAERLQQCYALLRTHDAYDGVMQGVVPKLDVDRWFYHYQSVLGDNIRSKYDARLKDHVISLFQHRFAELRRLALVPKQQLQQQYNTQIVTRYALSSVQAALRPAALEALRQAPVNGSFTPAFRKLYKMAELLDDAPALAALNHRLEITPDEGRYVRGQAENPSFTRASRQYLRRRIVRRLRTLGRFAPQGYLALAREILVLAADTAAYAAGNPEHRHFPTLAGLNFILHRHSQVYQPDYKDNWHWHENRKTEASQPEAYATLWAYAGADLLYILQHCQAVMVNDFALRRLQPQTAFLQEQPLETWLRLVQRPYENTATLAWEYLQPHLHQLVVLLALLAAHFASLRQHALARLTPAHFAAYPDLLLSLLLSVHPDVQTFARQYVHTLPDAHLTLLPLLLARPEPALQALGISLLARLEDTAKRPYLDLLCQALTAEQPDLRRSAQTVVLAMRDLGLLQTIFNHILPSLFRAEPVAGYGADLLLLVQALAPLHASLDIDLLWRLLQAKSRLAEQAAALILPAHAPQHFSVKQLALLSRNPTLTVRTWALNALQADLDRVRAAFAEAVRILDNRWENSRAQAIALLRTLEPEFWTSERVIAVCDQVYPDVQQFGRELVLRGLQQPEGEQYLLRLSQHPAQNVQLFVSNFLQTYAGGKPTVILSLQAYFTTVLTQVNRGRLIKDRVLAFLFREARQDTQVAQMVAGLFSEQSLSRVLADKGRYIETLFDLQQRYGLTQTPVRVIAPSVRMS